MRHQYNIWIEGGVDLPLENGITHHWVNALTVHSLSEMYDVMEKYDWWKAEKWQRKHNKWVCQWFIENSEKK